MQQGSCEGGLIMTPWCGGSRFQQSNALRSVTSTVSQPRHSLCLDVLDGGDTAGCGEKEWRGRGRRRICNAAFGHLISMLTNNNNTAGRGQARFARQCRVFGAIKQRKMDGQKPHCRLPSVFLRASRRPKAARPLTLAFALALFFLRPRSAQAAATFFFVASWQGFHSPTS